MGKIVGINKHGFRDIADRLVVTKEISNMLFDLGYEGEVFFKLNGKGEIEYLNENVIVSKFVDNYNDYLIDKGRALEFLKSEVINFENENYTEQTRFYNNTMITEFKNAVVRIDYKTEDDLIKSLLTKVKNNKIKN